MTGTITDVDHRHLDACVELAAAAVASGEDPYAAVLVGPDGLCVAGEHNRTADGDGTQHAELLIARWAVVNLTPQERASARMYSTCEPCPMCAGAHGWVGLGRLVYLVSAERVGAWRAALGAPQPPVKAVPARAVLPEHPIDGPVDPEDPRVGALQELFHRASSPPSIGS